MSYSKFHYLEKAVNELNKSLKEKDNNYEIIFKDDFHQVFSLAYLSYQFTTKKIDFNCTVENAIKNLNTKSIVEQFVLHSLNNVLNEKFIYFNDVPSDEAKLYLFSFYEYINPRNQIATFETPWEIAKLACQILEPNENDTVADFCCGINNFSTTLAENYEVKSITGYEIQNDIACIAEILNEIRELNVNVINTNILSSEVNTKYSKIFCDAPFNIKLFDFPGVDYYLNKLGIKKVSSLKSEQVFIQKIIDSLTPDGKAIVLVPLGFLFRKSNYLETLVEQGYINAVIQFSNNLLPATAIPFAMLVLSFNNKTIRIVDASDIFTKSRWKNILSVDDINCITNSYYEDSNISKKITKEDITLQNYDLSPFKYFYNEKINIKENNYIKLEDLSTIKRGVQYKAEELDSKETLIKTNYYYLTANGIQNNAIIDNLPNLAEIEEDKIDYCLQENDILIPIIKTNPLKIAVAKNIGNKKIVVSSNLYIVRCNNKKILPGYLKAYFEKEETFKTIDILSLKTINISREILNNIMIPVPSLEKQQKIVTEYEIIQKKIDLQRKELLALENIKAQFVNEL